MKTHATTTRKDLTPLIGEVAERLEQHIIMFNDANDYLSDEITFDLALAEGKENLEDTDFQSLLPHLSTNTLPPDFSERILAAIHTSFKQGEMREMVAIVMGDVL